jgi:hypothetical protein
MSMRIHIKKNNKTHTHEIRVNDLRIFRVGCYLFDVHGELLWEVRSLVTRSCLDPFSGERIQAKMTDP